MMSPMLRTILGAGLIIALGAEMVFSQMPESALGGPSAYVQRMLSLDRDGSGTLSASELPGKLGELIRQHDQNADGVLDVSELTQIESAAMQQRNSQAPTSESSENTPGRRGGRRAASQEIGSPLDPAQILKFALTFDKDGDGGLNAGELKAYAQALAARRSQGRGPLLEGRTDDPANGSGRPSPSATRKNDAAGRPAAPKGLGKDGRGDGGFGDPTPTR
ncbi:MAG: hypothetical protein R3C49_01935 [Planctomycetaceae bacterium]